MQELSLQGRLTYLGPITRHESDKVSQAFESQYREFIIDTGVNEPVLFVAWNRNLETLQRLILGDIVKVNFFTQMITTKAGKHFNVDRVTSIQPLLTPEYLKRNNQ